MFRPQVNPGTNLPQPTKPGRQSRIIPGLMPLDQQAQFSLGARFQRLSRGHRRFSAALAACSYPAFVRCMPAQPSGFSTQVPDRPWQIYLRPENL